MKKLIKYSAFALMAAVALVSSSCTSEYEYDAPAPVKDNAKATLSAEEQNFDLEADEATKTIEFTVKREKSDAAGTVRLVSSSDKFSVPSEVSFAAGEKEKTITATATVDTGETLAAIVSIVDDDANLYSDYKLEFKVFRDDTYSSLGAGKVSSQLFGQEFGAEFQKADHLNWYKVVSPYEEGHDIVFKVGDDGKTVTVAKQAAFNYSSYGICTAEGNGTLVDGVITVALTFKVTAGTVGQAIEIFTLPQK